MRTTKIGFVAGSLFAVAVIAVQTIGCGAMSSSLMNSNRVLQSMTITPASADAQASPGGQVQFTATGKFSKSPSPAAVTFVPPYSGSWASSDPNIATVNSSSGLATCVAGASGTVTVTAMASTNAATGTAATSTAVQGMAKLTCP